MEGSESELTPNVNHGSKVDVPVVRVKYHKKKLERVMDDRQRNKEAHIAAARKAATVKTITIPVKLTPGVDVLIKPRINSGLSKSVKDKIKEKESNQKPPSDLDAYV